MRNVHIGNDVHFMLKVLKYSLDKNTLFIDALNYSSIS